MKKKPPPLVLIDASDIDQPSGGRTAVLELFKEVFGLAADWRFIILLSRREPDFDRFASVHQHRIPFRRRVLERLYIQGVIFLFVWFRGVRLVHFSRTLGGMAWPAKSVLTIFDLTTLRLPALHSAAAVMFWKHLQPYFLRRADRIVSISEHVRLELEAYYRLPPEKMAVVPCAPKTIFHQPARQTRLETLKKKYALPDSYLLFIGMLARKKNLSTLLGALNLLQKQGKYFPTLILAGRLYRQSDDSRLLEQIQAQGLAPRVRYIGPVLDEELPALYRGAEIFIFPSLDEGFGIPCLEAMVCEVPVIAARRGAIPEITGEAAWLLQDPEDAGELAAAIHKVLTDPVLQEALIRKGRIRGRAFLWPDQAKRLIQLYKELLP